MVSLARRPNPARTPQGWATSSSDGSKAYHATGEWGKRGMTLQELTRAFDAFNEHEERLAIGFAWSEDCLRKLEEPLSGVKTVFSDLDGLRPLSPSDTPSSSSPLTPTTISSYQLCTLRQNSITKITDEFGCVVRTSGIEAPYDNGSGNSSPTGSALEFVTKVDEDTIKPAHKRRRSLSAISSPPTSPASEECIYDVQLEDHTAAEDLPERPPSRLGFFDREVEEDDIGYECLVNNLDTISSRDMMGDDTAYFIG